MTDQTKWILVGAGGLIMWSWYSGRQQRLAPPLLDTTLAPPVAVSQTALYIARALSPAAQLQAAKAGTTPDSAWAAARRARGLPV